MRAPSHAPHRRHSGKSWSPALPPRSAIPHRVCAACPSLITPGTCPGAPLRTLLSSPARGRGQEGRALFSSCSITAPMWRVGRSSSMAVRRQPMDCQSRTNRTTADLPACPRRKPAGTASPQNRRAPRIKSGSDEGRGRRGQASGRTGPLIRRVPRHLLPAGAVAEDRGGEGRVRSARPSQRRQKQRHVS
jgi:hypothetical protein